MTHHGTGISNVNPTPPLMIIVVTIKFDLDLVKRGGWLRVYTITKTKHNESKCLPTNLSRYTVLPSNDQRRIPQINKLPAPNLINLAKSLPSLHLSIYLISSKKVDNSTLSDRIRIRICESASRPWFAFAYHTTITYHHRKHQALHPTTQSD